MVMMCYIISFLTAFPGLETMRGWGTIFSLSVDDLLALNVPIASVGPAGKDAHKDTERLELEYSFETAPRILERVIRELGISDC